MCICIYLVCLCIKYAYIGTEFKNAFSRNGKNLAQTRYLNIYIQIHMYTQILTHYNYLFINICISLFVLYFVASAKRSSLRMRSAVSACICLFTSWLAGFSVCLFVYARLCRMCVCSGRGP